MKNKSIPLVISLLAILLAVILLSPGDSLAEGALAGVKVCLDPGHGGSDAGAINMGFLPPDGLHESDINLDVSFALKHLLQDAGAEVVLTREDDSYLTNKDRYTFCNEQEATILVSVHTNSVTDPTWDGSMALYAPSRDADLAAAIHEKMLPFLRDTAPDGVAEFRDFGIDNFASGVLFKCNMPAAMMEPLFMSHPAEGELLVQPVFSDPTLSVFAPNCEGFSCRRGDIAQAIFLGILAYYADETAPTMHVSAIEMSYQQKRANFFVSSSITVHDSAHNVVPGATVAHTFTLPDGSAVYQTGISDDQGTVTFKVKSSLSGEYESAVSSISKTGWIYDPAANQEANEILLVP